MNVGDIQDVIETALEGEMLSTTVEVWQEKEIWRGQKKPSKKSKRYAPDAMQFFETETGAGSRIGGEGVGEAVVLR